MKNINENRVVVDIDNTNEEIIEGVNNKSGGLSNCEEGSENENSDSSSSTCDSTTRLSRFMKGKTFT